MPNSEDYINETTKEVTAEEGEVSTESTEEQLLQNDDGDTGGSGAEKTVGEETPRATKRTPDGYRKAEIEPIRKQAKKDAERIVEIATDKMDLAEDEYSQEAMKTAVEIMRVPGSPEDFLLQTCSRFTKAKPASKLN